MNEIMGIRWMWYTPESEFQGYPGWKSPTELMQQELDYDGERSMEVDYRSEGWWCNENSFGLVVNPTSGLLRKVWASDAHTFSEDGILISDDFGDEEEELEWEGFAQSWEDAHRILAWRNATGKDWWAEGTFTPQMAKHLVSFAMMENPTKDVLIMLDAARQIFGDLPIIRIQAHPNHGPSNN